MAVVVIVSFSLFSWFFLLAPGCAPPSLPPNDPARPDLVLVSIDTLRADHLSSYGYERPTSPFLDRAAAAGVRFTNARSPSPWTLPAHATLLSGRDVHHHGVVEDNLRLGDRFPLLPEVLAGVGHDTAAFVSTFYVSRKFGFERGFHHFEDFGIASGQENLAKNVSASKVVDSALRWLARRESRAPVFLFLHFYDVHYPYDPPAPHRTLFDRAPARKDLKYKNYAHYLKHPVDAGQMLHQVAQYDEAIHYVDAELERLAEAYARAGRTALFAYTADHGEEFGERGSWGHAHTLYPEQLHVPLILRGPGLPEGRVIEAPVCLSDVAPTLAALAGTTLAADGLDLLPALRGEPLPARAFISETSRFNSNRLGYAEGGWRLDLDLKDMRRQLHDLASDPGETRNVLQEHPDRAADMERALLAALGTPWRALEDLRLDTQGFFVRDAALAGRSLDLTAGERFQVLPLDAILSRGNDKRRWRASGRLAPQPGDPVAADGLSGDVSLSAEERKRLEKLGYIDE